MGKNCVHGLAVASARAQPEKRRAESVMTFDLDRWAGDGASSGDGAPEAADHWLDDALRAVPLPDGFLGRLAKLADAPAGRAETYDGERDRNDRFAATRGLAGTKPRGGASSREIRAR
jgi:hypothetical protein